MQTYGVWGYRVRDGILILQLRRMPHQQRIDELEEKNGQLQDVSAERGNP